MISVTTEIRSLHSLRWDVALIIAYMVANQSSHIKFSFVKQYVALECGISILI